MASTVTHDTRLVETLLCSKPIQISPPLHGSNDGPPAAAEGLATLLDVSDVSARRLQCHFRGPANHERWPDITVVDI